MFHWLELFSRMKRPKTFKLIKFKNKEQKAYNLIKQSNSSKNMKFLTLFFIALSGVFVHGCNPGDKRIIMMADSEDTCVQDAACYDHVKSAIEAALSEDKVRALRGNRELMSCNACTLLYGSRLVCVFYGYCSRRGQETDEMDMLDSYVEADLDDPDWQETGIKNEAALAAQMKIDVNEFDISGLSFRIQVCNPSKP